MQPARYQQGTEQEKDTFSALDHPWIREAQKWSWPSPGQTLNLALQGVGSRHWTLTCPAHCFESAELGVPVRSQQAMSSSNFQSPHGNGGKYLCPPPPARLPLMYSRKLCDGFALETLGCGAYETEIKELYSTHILGQSHLEQAAG